MDYGIHSVLLDHSSDADPVGDVPFDQWYSGDCRAVSKLEGVEDYDVVPLLEKQANGVRPDVAGAARYEDSHCNNLRLQLRQPNETGR